MIDKYGNKRKQSSELVEAIKLIIKYNPVFRLRDSRMDDRSTVRKKTSDTNFRLKELFHILSSDAAVSATTLNSLLKNFNSFFDNHLTSYRTNESFENKRGEVEHRDRDEIVDRPISLESPEFIKQTLNSPGVNKSKLLVSMMAINMLLSKGNRQIDQNSRPIIIFEDIESRLHPSLLLSLWSIIEPTSSQKIVTTNSGDLLSSISLECLRRLDRAFYDTTCYKIDKSVLNYEDMRKIAFHVRMNRPMAFFARTWILVEGETEVWMLTQVASILGISLQCQGIRIIEFAQCGLKPLIKIAIQLGIKFHVLTDGDDAGKKYADTTRAFINAKNISKYLTVLPQKDIEHYLFASGYAKVIKQAAGLAANTQLKKGLNADKVIDMAIKKKTKPGLALLLVDAIQKRGIQGIPVEFARIIQTVLSM